MAFSAYLRHTISKLLPTLTQTYHFNNNLIYIIYTYNNYAEHFRQNTIPLSKHLNKYKKITSFLLRMFYLLCGN